MTSLVTHVRFVRKDHKNFFLFISGFESFRRKPNCPFTTQLRYTFVLRSHRL